MLYNKLVIIACVVLSIIGIQACSENNDANIANKVKSNIAANGTLTSSNIVVDVQDGIVFLSGRVDNSDKVQTAIIDAQSVPGVKRVDSKIVVQHAANDNTAGSYGSSGNTTNTDNPITVPSMVPSPPPNTNTYSAPTPPPSPGSVPPTPTPQPTTNLPNTSTTPYNFRSQNRDVNTGDMTNRTVDRTNVEEP